MAGYSGTPLPRKLGIKADSRVLLVDPPAGLDLPSDDDGAGPFDVIVVFCPDEAALRERFPAAKQALAISGRLWVCWPKKSSGVPTDLSENPIRDYGLAEGLVDNKVAAIDETWSGLQFVYRLADRKG
ncbi:hypothetical protein J5X84_41005 [Streptosporangiaceae bacterium NEAU-GS5]|nr:hypothetical protein [Streptosporangiaceae bacterium NEAU-GS5]